MYRTVTVRYRGEVATVSSNLVRRMSAVPGVDQRFSMGTRYVALYQVW